MIAVAGAWRIANLDDERWQHVEVLYLILLRLCFYSQVRTFVWKCEDACASAVDEDVCGFEGAANGSDGVDHGGSGLRICTQSTEVRKRGGDYVWR